MNWIDWLGRGGLGRIISVMFMELGMGMGGVIRMFISFLYLLFFFFFFPFDKIIYTFY